MNEYASSISLSTQNDWLLGDTFTVTGWGTTSVR